MRIERDLQGIDQPEALAIDELRDPAAFAALREDWGALMAQSGAGIFNAWEWLYPWYRRLAPGADLRILTARDRTGRLLGVLPLKLETRRVLGRAVRKLSFLGDRQVGSDYLDVIAASGEEERVTRAFASALRARAGEWDLLELLDLGEASTTPGFLRQEFRGHTVRRGMRSVCPWETFAEGETFEVFLKRTRRRDNYLRRLKWLQSQPGYRVEIATRPEELARPLSEFFRLHAMRWAIEGGSAGINTPDVEAFHRDATWLLAESGKLRLYTLWLGEQALASVYGVVHGETFHYYQAGYDPEWRARSVGLVLVGATFEDALGLGLRQYDFLRGTEPYKSDWVSKTRHTVSVRVFPPDGPGAFMDLVEQSAREVKDAIKRVLPEKWVDRARELRRRIGR